MSTYSITLPFAAGTSETVTRLNDGAIKANYIVANKFPTLSHRGLYLGSGLGAAASLAVATQIGLVNADEIVMSDGERIPSWSGQVLDSTASGAGGLDTGSIAFGWYEVHAIRNSSSGAKALLAHAARSFANDNFYATSNADSTGNLRAAAATTQIAQGFKMSGAVPIAAVDLLIARVGSPTGSIWLEVQADSAGVPSGTSLSTSDALSVAGLSTSAVLTRFILRNQFTAAGSSTQYWLVVRGNYTIAAGAYVAVSLDASSPTYANGSYATHNGTSWTADATKDLVFTVIRQNAAVALTMPSPYDQSALLGYAYYTGSGWQPYTQIGKTVTYQQRDQVNIPGFTNATAPLISAIPTQVPPTFCFARLRCGHSVANTGVIAVPLGIGPYLTPTLGAYVGYSGPALSTAGTGIIGEVPIDVQAMYTAVAAAGTGQIFFDGYVLP